ncbi:peptidyl-prolyl cis-trans isomerase [Fervidobacterium islandicum]|uniref:Peptidyl-prolyl cis-trans isomerase n=1 Tax=Fervidobacterium islandicum TaxID=2423 RepID=A0AAI8CMB0_FERIS|nr:peptidylprolyl isomerase [Fervidobacterium islandicum]AMW33092.1 peptidyl-prolyl cis-trans isomerase [Fervidobacterium islandicum]
MSKESKDVKLRKHISKWQQVFIWIIAIAFIAGIALWALAVNYTPGAKKMKRTLEETAAYLTKDGTPLKNETYWVFPEDIEQVYGNLLAQYGNPSLDPVTEEPYVKTLIAVDLLNKKLMLYYAEVNNIKPDKNKVKEEVKKEIDELKKDNTKLQQIKTQYGSLTNYEKELTRQKEQELTIQAVRDKLGAVTDKEIQNYYDKNKQDIINKYTKAETSYLTFESKEEMEKFVKSAMEKGVTQAASEASLTLTDYTLNKGTLPEELENMIFDATSTLVSFPYNDTYFVFNVKSVQKVDTFENFKKSDAFNEIVTNLKNERFGENFKKWKEENKIAFEIRDPVYNAWYRALTSEGKDLLTAYKKFYEEFFTEKEEVKSDIPAEQKAAFLVIADRIIESTDTALETVKGDVREFEKKVVLSIYEQVKGSSLEILRRMKEYYPDRKDITYDYYSKLYDTIKPYLSIGGAYYVMNQLFEVYQGFADLAEATNVDVKIRADSYYKLYEMNKLLDDPKTAKGYLAKLKELKPDYSINFDSAEKELEDMIKQKEAEATQTTNESTQTTNNATQTSDTNNK